MKKIFKYKDCGDTRAQFYTYFWKEFYNKQIYGNKTNINLQSHPTADLLSFSGQTAFLFYKLFADFSLLSSGPLSVSKWSPLLVHTRKNKSFSFLPPVLQTIYQHSLPFVFFPFCSGVPHCIQAFYPTPSCPPGPSSHTTGDYFSFICVQFSPQVFALKHDQVYNPTNNKHKMLLNQITFSS